MVVDTSALMCILLKEDQWERYLDALLNDDHPSISTATLVETNIVALRKKVSGELDSLLRSFNIDIQPLTLEQVQIARSGDLNFGKGRHPARLNLGDSFAYALAIYLNEQLLFKGNDFAQTDVKKALEA